MKPLEMALVPTPGAKPEFLASVIPLPKGEAQKAVLTKLWESITCTAHASNNKPVVVVLEGYTRDAWALPQHKIWQTLQVRSVDGKNKLPGFTTYLKERQKTAFGRFLGKMGTQLTTFVWVVGHEQTSGALLQCRVAPLSTIPQCPLKPKTGDQRVLQQQQAKQAANTAAVPKTITTATASAPPPKKGFGLLGNLVGAQKRTNQHVVQSSSVVAPKAAAAAVKRRPSAEATAAAATTTTSHDDAAQDLKTSTQILADFRQEMGDKMMDFDIAPDPTLTVNITLSDYTKQIPEADQGKVTMEVLKYIVYEQAEEVNEEWIVHKEPSEFMDEAAFIIYKDAEEAPEEVLEELNRAELPDEMLAQQKVIADQRRQQEIKALREQEQLQRELLKNMAGGGEDDDEADLAALNTQKRDRRTIEEIQRDNESKRQRTE